jgi:hypothetical protein
MGYGVRAMVRVRAFRHPDPKSASISAICILFVIIVFGHPFPGYGRISPEPFVRTLPQFRSLGD